MATATPMGGLVRCGHTVWTLLLAVTACHGADDLLPSWRDGATKSEILSFVTETTTEGHARFVPPAERIAVFDNDGTLWCEQPIYVQGVFVIARIRELAVKEPQLLLKLPIASLLSRDPKEHSRLTDKDIASFVAVTHSGMTTDEFHALATKWISEARHPKLQRLYTDCVYQPQLELMTLLRSRGYKTFIVTGGGVDFVRTFAEQAYGIPPEQVIGTSGKTKFELRGEDAVLMKLPELQSLDDGVGKPENIERHIGRRPILACGNSDGDLPMLQYTASHTRPSLMLLVHHDDAERDFSYDKESRIGRLDKALTEAEQRQWTVISMQKDWGRIFPDAK